MRAAGSAPDAAAARHLHVHRCKSALQLAAFPAVVTEKKGKAPCFERVVQQLGHREARSNHVVHERAQLPDHAARRMNDAAQASAVGG
jgi:hypothetical protein